MKHALMIDYVDPKTHHEFHVPVAYLKRSITSNEYKKLEKILDELIDEVRGNESHPLADLMQLIGENLEYYDDQHAEPIGANVSDVDMVKHLMSSYGLVQNDLADIFGSQANVSKFLNGQRGLSKHQIAGLKKRFGISADFFIREEK